MKFRDLVRLALGNLFQQKWRTLLNIGGVFAGCLLLFITLAATRGIESGIRLFFEQNHLLRRIEFVQEYMPDGPVPPEISEVDGQMSEERRARIRKRREESWQSKNHQPTRIDRPFLDELASIPRVVEVIPSAHLGCTIDLEDASMDGVSFGISTEDPDIRNLVIVGQPLRAGDDDGLLINEFTAWQLGWKDDAQLDNLIGKTIQVTHQISGRALGWSLTHLQNPLVGSTIARNVDLISTIQQLVEDLDATSLSDEQKNMLREILGVDAIDTVGDVDAVVDNDTAGEVHRSESNRLTVRQSFTVRGVFRNADEEHPFGVLASRMTDSQPDIYLIYPLSTELYLRDADNEGFWNGTVIVESYRDLETVSQELQDRGLHAWSASWLVTNIDEQFANARKVAAGIAFVIFLVAAIGIANSMTISVLQRTREIGIMKALGARDSGVLGMMLLEGTLTGLVGVTSALFVAATATTALTSYVRGRWLSHLDPEFTRSIFSFSLPDVLPVFGIALAVCTVAAIMPARRAARLDPVEAMRR